MARWSLWRPRAILFYCSSPSRSSKSWGRSLPPTIRYLIPEASSAANRSVQSFSPGARVHHLVVEFAEFEDGGHLFLGRSLAPEFLRKSPVSVRDFAFGAHHARGPH